MIKHWEIESHRLEDGDFKTRHMKTGYVDQRVMVKFKGESEYKRVSMWKHIIENYIYYKINNIEPPKIFNEVVEELFKNEDGLYDPEKGLDGRNRLKDFVVKVLRDEMSIVQAMIETQFKGPVLNWARDYWNKKSYSLV